MWCTLLLATHIIATHISKAAAHQQSQTEWCSGPRRLAGEPPADQPALLTHTAQTITGCAEPAPINQRSWIIRLHFAALPSAHLCRRGSWWGPVQVKHAQLSTCLRYTPGGNSLQTRRTKIMLNRAGTARPSICVSYLLCSSAALALLAHRTARPRRSRHLLTAAPGALAASRLARCFRLLNL